MANKKWSDVYISNPSTKIQATDIVNLGRSGSPTAGQWGTLSQHTNIIYITNNGDDTHGNGSLLSPYATGPAVETFIVSSSPSATNKFVIFDQRTGVINENISLIPFVERIGNGTAQLNGNLSLNSLFSSISSDSYSALKNYASLGNTTPGTIIFNFTTFSTSHGAHITLQDFEKVVCTGSYIGNDSANFNADSFRVNEINFNTSGVDPDHTQWRSNIAISSGVTRRIRYCEGWQCTSVTKSLGLVPAITFLDVAFCGNGTFDSATNNLLVINIGSASNQPEIRISALACATGDSILQLDINSDARSQITFITDITTGYYINAVTSLTNISFNNFCFPEYQSTQYLPVNYNKTPYNDGSFDVTTDMIGSQFAGIDAKLGTIGPGSSSYPPHYIYGFQLTWNSVGPPSTITIGTGVCIDSTNSFNMSFNSPVTLDTTSASIDNGGTWTDGRWYAVWLYENSTTLATTVKFSLSFSSPATISGYDKWRLVRSVKASSAFGPNILAVVQTGLSNYITYTWINSDISLGLLSNGNAVSGSPGTFSCTGAMSPISSEINIQMIFTPGVSRAGDTANITDSDFNTLPMTYISGPVPSILSSAPSGYLPVNSSQNLSYYVDNSADRLDLICTGYKESL